MAAITWLVPCGCRNSFLAAVQCMLPVPATSSARGRHSIPLEFRESAFNPRWCTQATKNLQYYSTVLRADFAEIFLQYHNYIWPSGRPGSARPGHGPGTARWCRAGTARRAPRAVPYRASCPVDSPSTAPRAEIRAVPPAQPRQNLRVVPAHNLNCRKPLIRFLINSTFIILTTHSQNHKNNLTI